MRFSRSLFFLAAATSLAIVWSGCKNQEAGAKTETPPKANGKPAPKAVEPPSKPGLSLDQLPPDLRNPAFEYYGLGSAEPQAVEVLTTSNPEPESGEQIFRLKEIKDGKAVFEVERTGALASQGTGEMLLTKDGLYTSKLWGTELKPPQLEIPADLTIGRTWVSKGEITLPTGQKTKLDNSWRVAAQEKVKTKAGEFDAIRIDGGGSMTTDGQKMSIRFKGWFVKGRGGVKIELHSTGPARKAESVTIEAVR